MTETFERFYNKTSISSELLFNFLWSYKEIAIQARTNNTSLRFIIRYLDIEQLGRILSIVKSCQSHITIDNQSASPPDNKTD
jgi:hypothetical protein